MENGAIAHLVEGQSGYVGESYAITVVKGEVFCDKGDRVRARPQRVFDPGVCGVVIIAPFALAAAGVPAEEDPVARSGGKAVRSSRPSTPNDGCHHGVVNHLAAVWDVLIFADRIGHESDIVDLYPETR
jgi:hypothetical protein